MLCTALVNVAEDTTQAARLAVATLHAAANAAVPPTPPTHALPNRPIAVTKPATLLQNHQLYGRPAAGASNGRTHHMDTLPNLTPLHHHQEPMYQYGNLQVGLPHSSMNLDPIGGRKNTSDGPMMMSIQLGGRESGWCTWAICGCSGRTKSGWWRGRLSSM